MTVAKAGNGCNRALVKSCAGAMAASVNKDFGIETVVGNQTTVSTMCSDYDCPVSFEAVEM